MDLGVVPYAQVQNTPELPPTRGRVYVVIRAEQRASELKFYFLDVF